MTYNITFITNRKAELFDDVKSIILHHSIPRRISLRFEDGSQEEVSDVLGIWPYFYNEG